MLNIARNGVALSIVIESRQKLGVPMNRNILDIRPRNLPVYVYHLEADIALVHKQVAYKLKGYSFSRISVRANQPLKAGDVVSNHCCYYGNSFVELIPYLCKKKKLGLVKKEFLYYYGCQINRMAISFVNRDSLGDSCGLGQCTVFIGLSGISNLGYWKKLIKDWDTRFECIGEVPSDLID